MPFTKATQKEKTKSLRPFESSMSTKGRPSVSEGRPGYLSEGGKGGKIQKKQALNFGKKGKTGVLV